MRLLLAALIMAAAPAARAADIGSGFGERLWALTSARQAASGGVQLEDPWRQGNLLETSTVLLGPGLQWYGLGYQGGFGDIRFGVEGFLFSAPGIVKTVENSDGTYAGEDGEFDESEWGGRAVTQFTVLEYRRWKIAALARVSGMIQNVPDGQNSGVAIEVGGQGQQPLGDGRALTAWALVGPVGQGTGAWFTRQVQVGGGIMGLKANGFFFGEEGYSAGVDLQVLGEGLVHGGGGLAYWFGNHTRDGFTFSFRFGARYAQESAEVFQPRFGVGALWRGMDGWGFQVDYAYVPLGELGGFNYATLSVRMPEPDRPPPVEKTVESAEPVPEEVIYFYPQKGEVARLPIEVEEEARVGVELTDANGHHILTLFPLQPVPEGTWPVVWNGKLAGGELASFGVFYYMVVSVGERARTVKVVPLEAKELQKKDFIYQK